MTSLDDDVAQSNERRCHDDGLVTSQTWRDTSYCTPASVPLTRCAATRRLVYSAVPSAPLLLFHTSTTISTTPTPNTNRSASNDLHSMTLTSSKVTGGQHDVVTPFQFNEEQIECICDVLRQSKDVDRLSCFLDGLTHEQQHRDSEQLYKVVDRLHANVHV